VQPFGVLQVAPKASVEQGLEAALENALAHWLYHDEVWSAAIRKQKGDPARYRPGASCAGAVWRHRAA
jgi:triphosphatase